jgi:hypothetical protein
VLRMTHCLINVTICAKYFQNALIYENVMDRTQNIQYLLVYSRPFALFYSFFL